MQFKIQNIPGGGYYTYRTDEQPRDYKVYAFVLPQTNKRCQNRDMLKAKIMTLLRKLLSESIWSSRTLPSLHQKLLKNVVGYSPTIMEFVLGKDNFETIFDNIKVDLEKTFEILSDVDSDETLRDDELWLTPISISRSSTLTILVPNPMRPKPDFELLSDNSENSENSGTDLSFNDIFF